MIPEVTHVVGGLSFIYPSIQQIWSEMCWELFQRLGKKQVSKLDNVTGLYELTF